MIEKADDESLNEMKKDNVDVIQNNDEKNGHNNNNNIINTLSEKDIKSLFTLKEYCASVGLEYRFDL